MVSIDTGYLGLLLHPGAKPPIDPATKKPLIRAQERIEKLLNLTSTHRMSVSSSERLLCYVSSLYYG